MELKVQDYQLPAPITFNYDDLKRELLAKAEAYETVVYTEDQIKAAKADRANLNRLKKALNDERIKRERDYMQPFNTFKAQVNEIIGIIDKPCAAIDRQIKGFEDRQKEEKLNVIKEYFAAACLFGNPASDIIAFDKIFNPRWLNASVPLKSINDEIDGRLEQIAIDLEVVRNLPVYAFVAEQTYLLTLDLGKAVSEAHSRQEMDKKREAYEAERKKAISEPVKAEPVREEIPAEEPRREWIGFRAFLTVDDAKALKEFFNSRGIRFESI